MIAVPGLRAYALSRPAGWAAGWYDAELAEDGLRLTRDGAEVLFVPVDTPAVAASGAHLTLPTPAGELTVRLEPPRPADPTAVALGIVRHLTGRSVWAQTADPWWLGLLILPPAVIGICAAVWLGVPGRAIGSVGTIAALAVFARKGWAARDRAVALAAIGVGTFGFAAAVVLAAAAGR